MSNFQHNKALVLEFYDALDRANGDEVAGVLDKYTTPNYHFRGMHPFYEQTGADAVAEGILATSQKIL